MSETTEIIEKVAESEVFNVKLVKCSPPIMIKDNNLTTEENAESTQAKRDNGRGGYPPEFEDIFNCIFPPEEWEENGQTWRRLASTKPATREDIISLRKNLWDQMSYWHARTVGLCRVRRELFSQCFDEMIRQITLVNIQRGELLIRIRDEFNSTIEAYKQISEDCLLFNIRKTKADNHEVKISEMNYLSLREKRNLLKKELTIAELNYTNLKHELTEKLNALKMSNQHEIDFFTVNNDALNEQVKMLLDINN